MHSSHLPELLELRTFLSTSYDSATAVVTITGTASTDIVQVQLVSGTTVTITENSVLTLSKRVKAVKEVIFNGGDGNDEFSMTAALSIPCLIDGGNGSDEI